MRSIPEDTQQNVVLLIQKGCSFRKIAQQCNIGIASVHKIKMQHLPSHRGSKGGRPEKLSPQGKWYCVHAITAGKLETASQVTKKLKDDIGVAVSVKTVRRTLHKAGLHGAEKKQKPKLSPANIKARLEFARSHNDWTVDDWKWVIWSDETKINRFGSDGCAWYWKRDGE